MNNRIAKVLMIVALSVPTIASADIIKKKPVRIVLKKQWINLRP